MGQTVIPMLPHQPYMFAKVPGLQEFLTVYLSVFTRAGVLQQTPNEKKGEKEANERTTSVYRVSLAGYLQAIWTHHR